MTFNRCIGSTKLYFFFSSRRRHTRCYRDWSSDVCSSDLAPGAAPTARARSRAVFGTHDVGLIARLRERALAVGAAPGAYEVHMLYGIRAAEQRALQSEGVPVRVLISYGTHWFPWYMRRLAERPANVWFVVRNLL